MYSGQPTATDKKTAFGQGLWSGGNEREIQVLLDLTRKLDIIYSQRIAWFLFTWPYTETAS